MIFNSIEFLVFAILFFLLWPLMRSQDNSRWSFIVASSFLFYAWWDWRFLFLIIFSGLVDYCAGILMVKVPRGKKITLAISLFANLGSLFIFKYSVFFATTLENLLDLGGLEFDLVNHIPEFALILPVGISFYTFQSLSYTIDIYRCRLQPTKNILHFFSYLAMFPQLVAGPIIRAKDFLIQLKSFKIPNELERWNAIKMICYGLFQKVVIADNLSYFIDSAYQGKAMYSGTIFWWFISIAFSFQIYTDFSGYSLIARGLAKYMGYHFKMNFNHPYLSISIRQFWANWHISLSTWFRDYVYIPMGGSRKGVYYGILTLSITMLLSGIWHGANYTFIVWAGIHVFFLLIERHTKWNEWLKNFPFLLMIIVFVQVTIAWVYFRSSSIGQANAIIKNMFIFESSNLHFIGHYSNNIVFLILAVVIELVIHFRKKTKSLSRFYRKYQQNIDVALVSSSVILIIFFRGEGQQFIYFQF